MAGGCLEDAEQNHGRGSVEENRNLAASRGNHAAGNSELRVIDFPSDFLVVFAKIASQGALVKALVRSCC